jgi:lipid-A-disaccharide synthase-like uncharacterized protein
MNSAWTAYAVAQRLWGVLPVSVVAIGLYAMIALRFRRLAGSAVDRGLLGGLALVFPVPAAALALAGWEAAGIVLGFGYALQFAPAAVSVIRSATNEGVSRLTWILAVFEGSIWLLYGWSAGDPALVIGGGLLVSAIIVFRLALTGKALRA